MKSIRGYLTWILLMILGGVIVAGSVAVYPVVRDAMLSEFDYSLSAKLRALTLFPEHDRKGIDLDFTERSMPEFQLGESPEYYQVWLRGGTTYATSPSLEGHLLPCRCGPLAEPFFWDVTLPDGSPGRAIGVGFIPQIEDSRIDRSNVEGWEYYTVVVVFARNMTRFNGVLSGIRVGIVLGGAVLLLGTTFLIMTTLKRGLAPLDELAGKVMKVDASSLQDARFSSESLPRELAPIAAQLDDLVERLCAAFEQEKRLTADMAHELYTPLAGLRSAAEVAQKWPDDAEATRDLAVDTLQSVAYMQSIVGTLLSLSRCEAGTQTVARQDVDLSALLTELRETSANQARERDLVIEWDVPPGLVVRSDPGMFRSVASNLLDNAVAHVSPGGRVRCRLEEEDEGVLLTITNTCRGVDEEDLERFFQPMWRKDTARSGGAHSGLGLALVKGFTERLGIGMTADLSDADQLSIRLAIPHS